MALSLEDKILGEKTHYYCSSDEEGEDDTGSDGEETPAPTPQEPQFIPEEHIRGSDGRSVNTGPKGVVQDWRRFKQLETERRKEADREKAELVKKLAHTCRSHLDDEKEQRADDALMQELEMELDDLDKEFLKQYQEKRLEELRKTYEAMPKFGKVLNISKDEFVEAIDKEKPTVTVIVHLFEDRIGGCDVMNKCLDCLALEYPTVKFCRIRASEAKLSYRFSVSAVPALLSYKGGELIANFIQMCDELGNEFCSSDVEGFLLEHGLLPDQKEQAVIRSTRQDSDTDDDLD